MGATSTTGAALDAALDAALEEAGRAYAGFTAARAQQAQEHFLEEQYAAFDLVYREQAAGLSPAYLSGADWYFGPALPAELFRLVVLACLVQTACRKARRRGLLRGAAFRRVALVAAVGEADEVAPPD
jgi:hypothetical protein